MVKISNSIKDKTLVFIEKAKKIHGDKYDYSKVEYHKSSEKVIIICPKHGEFEQTPNSHLCGRGCSKCSNEKVSERCNKTAEGFIKDAIKVHGNKYDYSKVVYKDNRTKVCIICPIHGEFWQTPSHHLSGEGCSKCGRKACAERQMLTSEEFIERAKALHNDKYDYSKVEYNGYENYVTIGCPIHGYYRQSPDSHLHSGGCPKCGATLSKNEDEMIDFIKSIIGEENVVERDRKTLDNKEIDVLIPSKNIGFEYNGLYWHSERNNRIDNNYHLNKKVDAFKKGISLIHIFEDEYVLHKELVKNKIAHLLGCNLYTEKIMGRKCDIKEINKDLAKEFLNEYHIQGFTGSTLYLGAYYYEKLVAVMTFKKEQKSLDKWELNRFASDYHYILQGVGGKLFKYFIRNYKFSEIKSFLDRRWSLDEKNNIYTKLGFYEDKILPPDYYYYNERVDRYARIHKFNFRKSILAKKYNLDINSTENNMASELGYTKIWNCGLIKYVYKHD